MEDGRVYSPERKALNAALAAAQGEFPPIVKDKTAKAGSYSYTYASLDTILAAVRPVLASHGLAVVQRLENPAGHPSIRTEILHADGEAIAASFPLGELPESVQQLGSKITYLRRYALCSLLCLAAEDDDDAGQVEPPKRRRASPGTKQSDGPSVPDDEPRRPATPQAVAQPAATVGEEPTEPQKRKLFALFTRAGLTGRGERLDYAAAVIGRPLESANDLTRAEARKIIDQLESEPPIDES